MNFEPVIGLEVHVQLKTESKMFCRSKNAESDQANVHICEVCTGQPGVLPVINREAIRKTVQVGLALNCEIAEYSKFDRKNYFYPDLPKGYQISQFDMPINGKGQLTITMTMTGEKKTIGITRAHLEEDAGKLIHYDNNDDNDRSGQKSKVKSHGYSLVDYNRAGVPLLEIVSEPEIKSADEAKIYLQQLQNMMRYLGASDADMEKGHLRCDANISLRESGESGFPEYKVEVKNMNSFKAVSNALNYEIQRQAKVLDRGEVLASETRGWVEDKGITVLQRSKEESQDYRYFPEPDLPVLHLTEAWVSEIKRTLPELPAARLERFLREFKLTPADAQTLIGNKDLADYFEQVVSEFDAWVEAEDLKFNIDDRTEYLKLAANWVLGQFLSLLNAKVVGAKESKITPENFAELIKLIAEARVSQLSAKDVLNKMFETGGDPSNILDELGLAQVSDEAVIVAAVKKVIKENPKAVADAKTKGPKAFGFLVGQTMKELKGKGNPQVINELLKDELRKI
ncbi:MAG: Asp-tRNA(Asn)/Glu-tRNA(Gln) amidotransferase subunit GatB [Candidatus Doudnabacteria bacterium]|nr:Asp-tRNA(Asn)/Glu-tRNA(Gln) amidotransferase subunit GatB [Candidatus Doudnabacteria bacterium]